jgi:hypothetical protein
MLRRLPLLKTHLIMAFSGLYLCFTPPLWAETSQTSQTTVDLDIYHTGDVKGLASSYLYDVRLPYLMTSDFVQSEGKVLDIADFGVSRTAVYFHGQGHYLWGEKLGVRELNAFLSAPPAPLRTEVITLMDTQDSLILPGTATPVFDALARYAQQSSHYQKQVKSQSATLFTYPGGIQRLQLAQAQATAPVDPLLWEMVLGFEMGFQQKNKTTRHINLIGKPFGEGTRRMAQLEKLRTPDSVLVDAGDLLEGLSSVFTDQLSLQRSNSLKMAQRMGYFALNVGKEELRGGLTNLIREQEQYALPFVSASLRQAGQYVFPPYKIREVSGKKVAFVGLTDPQEISSLRTLGILSEGTEVLSPRLALDQVLGELKKQEQPDVIVVLADFSAEQLQEFEKYNRDVHLVLTDTEARLQSLDESMSTPLNTPPRAFVPRSSAFALNRVHLHLDDNRLQWMSEMRPIAFDLPPQADFLPPILAIRHAAYKDALDILIPNMGPLLREDPELLALFLGSASTVAARERLSGYRRLSDAEFLQIYQPYITRELLYNLEMNLLMDRFQSEVVVFKTTGQDALSIPGAMPRMLVYERLKINDTLHIYSLNGSQLDALTQITSDNLSFGGLRVSDKTVWGRPLGSKKTYYRVVMPSGVALLDSVQKVLGTTPNQAPSNLYMRNVLLQDLEALVAKPEPEKALAEQMRPRWHQKQTLFTLGLDDLQLNVSGYNAYNNQDYTQVRETRVISPNSFNFGGRTRLYGGLDNQWMGWTNAIQAKYEGLSIIDQSQKNNAGEALQRFTETQDDLLFSSELQLRLFKFLLFDTQIPLTPFLEGVYDTEFTPTVNKDTQLQNPLQSELRGVFGLSIPAGPRLKTFKTGLALRRDFNVPNNLEGGVDLKLVHEQPINTGLTWQNDLDARYFLPSPNDNASSLGLTAQWVSALRLSLTDNLSLRFFADAYLFQGKLPETSQLGASVILGVGLGYDRLWKPFYEPIIAPVYAPVSASIDPVLLNESKK